VTTPKETIWELDPHTRIKHEILRRYLRAWFPILGPHHPRVDYIDGFSGPGRYSKGEEGSPLIALDAAQASLSRLPPEVYFYFIEERPDRLAHLKTEVEGLNLPNAMHPNLLGGSFDEKILPVMAELAEHRTRPVFAFIDPFGFAHMPFSIVRSFLEHEHGEVLVTFMVASMNRFLDHPDEQIVSHIVEAFGSPLVGDIAGTGGGVFALRDLYQEQLRLVAKFVRHFEMRDADDRVIYYLFFASNNRLGHLKMKEAMWQLDPGGEFRFSDATNPDQLVLFSSPSSPPLSSRLRARFGTMEVTAGEVRLFVEDETAYLKSHMVMALRDMEQSGEVAVAPTKVGGGMRRRGSYPDDAVIEFGRQPKPDSGGHGSEQKTFPW
jgi:three-Cys-motif partner protein